MDTRNNEALFLTSGVGFRLRHRDKDTYLATEGAAANSLSLNGINSGMQFLDVESLDQSKRVEFQDSNEPCFKSFGHIVVEN